MNIILRLLKLFVLIVLFFPHLSLALSKGEGTKTGTANLFLSSEGNTNNYLVYFKEAYDKYPLIPKGILEAVAYSKTHIKHIDPTTIEASCMGLPSYYGVMGLIKDGKGYFNHTLALVDEYSAYTEAEIIESPEKNILAYAEAFFQIQNSLGITSEKIEYYYKILQKLSELPSGTDQQLYALDSEIYLIMLLLSDNQFMSQFGYSIFTIDMQSVFGEENFKVLSSKNVSINQSQKKIIGDGNVAYSSNQVQSCLDYPSATWAAASSSNYSSRSGTAISAVVMHTTVGSYSGTISWFQNSSASVSAHYVVRSYDGQVTQMVCEADKAWHVGSENPYTIGIEQEGYVDDPSWYTNALYQSSANIVKDIVASGYGIEALSTYDGPSSVTTDVLSTCYSIKGHQHFTNQTHTDPGEYWDWPRFFELINGSPSVTTYTSCSGTFKDPGGSSNYNDWDRNYWLIEPTGASAVTLSFSSFDLENGYDYLYVYDGDNEYGSLIGSYTGSTKPSSITASSGKLFVVFKSDCATTGTGWAASWNCSTTSASCGVPSNLNSSSISMDAATLSWTGVSGASKYIVKVKRSIESSWLTYTTTSTSYDISALASNAIYYWQVAAYCGSGDTSAFLGALLNTISPTSKTTDACTGTFYDSGGEDGGYTNYEDYTYTIAPSGAIALSVTFTEFNVESNYDYLYVYDGTSTSGTYLGKYTSTTSPGTIYSATGALTFRFTSDVATISTGWKATWTCTSDTTNPTTTISIANSWKTTDFKATFTDADNSNGTGIDKQFYLVSDFNGSDWRANTNNSFLYDDFSASSLSSEWTSLTGIWNVNASSLYQSDESVTNTNLYTKLTQGGGDTYFYSWDAMMDGSGSNRRSGIHIFVDDPTTSNRGNSYLIWPRLDDEQLHIYKVTNDVLTLETYTSINLSAGNWYNYKVIFNSNTGEMEVYIDDELMLTWTDASPFTSGDYLSLRTGDALVNFDNVKVYKSRGNSETITIGGNTNDDVRYQNPNSSTPSCKIVSVVKDGTGNFSTEKQAYANIDWTDPSAVSVVTDSLSIDKDTIYIATKISSSWTASSDANSDISSYSYALGSTPGNDDIIAWTNNNKKKYVSVSTSKLSLGQQYFFSVKATNGAGLESTSTISDGFMYIDPNLVTTIATTTNSAYALSVYPNPFSDKINITYHLNETATVYIKLMDVTGRIIYTSSSQNQNAGTHSLEINQTTNLATGIYLLEMNVGGESTIYKLMKE